VPRYRKKAVLIGTNLDFFHLLCRALPECHVFPQMALSALVEPQGTGRSRQSAFDRIATKRAGYAVFDKDMQLLAVVELNHKGRVPRKEAKREAYLASAGIRTIRFQSKQLPSESKIQRNILIGSTQESGQRTKPNTRINFSKVEHKRLKTPWRNTLNAHM
jgi:hypothetical protein